MHAVMLLFIFSVFACAVAFGVGSMIATATLSPILALVFALVSYIALVLVWDGHGYKDYWRFVSVREPE